MEDRIAYQLPTCDHITVTLPLGHLKAPFRRNGDFGISGLHFRLFEGGGSPMPGEGFRALAASRLRGLALQPGPLSKRLPRYRKHAAEGLATQSEDCRHCIL